jgi:DNA-binding NarL/FixJ family response regulator
MEGGAPMRLVAEVDARIRAVCVGPPLQADGPLVQVDAFADDIEVVTTLWPPVRVIEEIAEHVPDIVVIDYGPQTNECLAMIAILRKRFPLMKLVVVGPTNDSTFAREALRLGARAYLSRQNEADDFAASLRAIQAEHSVIDADIARSLFSDSGTRTPLRPVEVQVLRLLAQGMAHAEIAAQVQISRSTLKRYLNDIETKLQARNRVQAVAFAAKQGLI